MKKRNPLYAILAALLVVSLWGCSPSEPDTVGEHMEEAADEMGDAMDDATDGLEDAAEDIGDNIDDAGEELQEEIEG